MQTVMISKNLAVQPACKQNINFWKITEQVHYSEILQKIVSSNENCFFWNLELLLEGKKSENGSDKEIGV